jgi:hypothetical protein
MRPLPWTVRAFVAPLKAWCAAPDRAGKCFDLVCPPFRAGGAGTGPCAGVTLGWGGGQPGRPAMGISHLQMRIRNVSQVSTRIAMSCVEALALRVMLERDGHMPCWRIAKSAFGGAHFVARAPDGLAVISPTQPGLASP